MYKSLLEEAENHTSPESVVVCYADKHGALGEALHEIHAGNHRFMTPIVNEYGAIPLPTEYYLQYLQGFVDKFPAANALVKQPHHSLHHLPITIIYQ